jgi:Asp/Glu/hydantoin racemase
MKIGIMHVMPAVENSPEAEAVKAWDRLLRISMDKVKNKDTEIVFRISRRGLSEEAAHYRYMWAFSEIETLQGYLEMGRSGKYDAVMVMCFFDPKLREARQALDVPFIGPGETAMRIASMMGKRFGVISACESASCEVEENIQKYGLSELAVPVMGMPDTSELHIDKFKDAHSTITDFINISRKLIACGAEVIIPGCMINDAILHAAPGCEKDYPAGLNEIDGVPVINVNQLALKMAETFAAVKKAGSPWISRKLYFASSQGNKIAEDNGIQLIKYNGPGFWSD